MKLVLKVVWSLLALGVLFLTLSIYDGTPATRDAEVLLAYGMMALSFPFSQVCLLLLGAVGFVIEKWWGVVQVPNGYMPLFVSWLAFSLAGYWQWFVLLPWLWRKWTQFKASR
jgi:hypothetical protein